MGRGRDLGSAAAELVLVAPFLILLLLFVVAAGRLVQASLSAGSAAQQAARAASIARDPASADSDATSVARSALSGQGITCSPMAVNPDVGGLVSGGEVSVQVSCTVRLSDLVLLGVPGTETVSARAESPVDVYRGGPG